MGLLDASVSTKDVKTDDSERRDEADPAKGYPELAEVVPANYTNNYE